MTTVERTFLFTGSGALGWVLILGAVALVLTVTLYAVERKLIRPRVAAGRSGHMMAIERIRDNPYEAKVAPVPLDEVANAERLVPSEYIAGEGRIAAAFMTYLRPLLGGPLPPYVRLSNTPAQRRG